MQSITRPYQAVTQQYPPQVPEYKPYAANYQTGVKTYSALSPSPTQKTNCPNPTFLSHNNKKVAHYLSNQQFLLGLFTAHSKAPTETEPTRVYKKRTKKSFGSKLFSGAKNILQKAKTNLRSFFLSNHYGKKINE